MDEPDKQSLGIGKGTPGPGRPKGAANFITREIKHMVTEALEQAGGVDYLAGKAETHPAAFLSLVGRIVPLQVSADLRVAVAREMTDDELAHIAASRSE